MFRRASIKRYPKYKSRASAITSYKARGTKGRSRPRKGKYAKTYRAAFNPRANSFLSQDSYFAKLRFQDSIELDLPQVTFTDYLQYSMNSVWDPYYGAGGGTIKGHPEMSSIWNRYMVMGALFKLKGAFWSEDPNDMNNWSKPYAAFLQGEDSDASVAPYTPDIDRLAEQGNDAKYHVVVPAAGTAQRLCMIKKYFSVKKIEGCKIAGNIEQYSNLVTADPPRQPSVLVGITQVNQLGYYTIKFSGMLTIKYYVKYFERVENLP